MDPSQPNHPQDDTPEIQSSIFGQAFSAETAPAASAQATESTAPNQTSGGPQLSEQQQQYLQQQQLSFKTQQQQQFIQYQQMMASMPPQQQQIYQAQMMAVQQQQQQYQAAMLLKQQQQFAQQQKQQKKSAASGESKEVKEDAEPSKSAKPAPTTASASAPAAPAGASGDPASNANANMYAAFQYQQQQQKYNNQMTQINQMNQFNQMNPILYQQQMIQNMQYRQPHYNNRNSQYNNRGGRNEDKKEEKTSQDKPEKQSQPTQNDAQLKAQLEYIQKLTAEQEGTVENQTIDQKVNAKQIRLQALVQNLVEKIQKKHESLMISQQQLSIYQETLKQKYNPIFDQMDTIMKTKKLEYVSHLSEHLENNNARIQLEKDTLQKLEASWKQLTPAFKSGLEFNLTNIKILIERQKKIDAANKVIADKEAKIAEEKENPVVGEEDAPAKEAEVPEEPTEVAVADSEPKEDEPIVLIDSDLIKAISTMVDEFNNIVGKNFSVYAHYDDFSFGKSRSTEKVDEKLKVFFKENFSGEFQLKNSFEASVLPRIFYLEQKTKFIYSYKITNYMTQAIMIQNKFNIPDQSRYVVTPKGHLFVIGGFNPQTKEFLNEAYVLDEYRSLLKPLNDMFYPRAEHVVHKFKDNIYVLGGMAYREDKNGGRPFIQSLNTCEFFSISSKKWIMLPNFEKARQSFSICQFNEKYIFIIGGKCLKPEARIGGKNEWNFVQEVEAFDIEKNMWKTINFITDNLKLRIVHAGATQVTGMKIMIFGGMIEPEEGDEEKDLMVDNNQQVKLTDHTFFLDVTNGSIKRGPDLNNPSYYINNGGNLLSIQNKLYAQGFGISPDTNKSIASLAAKDESTDAQIDASNTYGHKKILHCYNLAEQEFTEIHEGIFSASTTRKQSFDLDD